MGLIESWGSGIPRVKQEIAERGLREPEFTDLDGRLRVNLWRPTAEQFGAYLRGEGDRAIGRRSAESDDNADKKPIATDRDALIVRYLESAVSANADELAGVLNLGKDRTRTVLRDMVHRGIIVKLGDKRYTRYSLPEVRWHAVQVQDPVAARMLSSAAWALW